MSENATTYNRILSKGIESKLPAIEDGKLRFTTDTARLFLDNGNTRIEITDFVKGKTASEIKGILAPLPKLYLASDTHEVYFYDNGWQTVVASDCVNASTAQYAVNASTAEFVQNASTASVSNGDIISITRSGLTFTATKRDGSTFTFTQKDDNTTYANATTASNGLLPKLGGGTTNYLRADGSWAKPNDTTYAVATTAANGLLPKLGGGTTNFLRADGSWAKPNDTTYANATTASNGLLPKLGGGTTNYLRADGTWVKPPNDNTTYANATTASNGLLPKLGGGTTNYLRADGTWAKPNDTTYANMTSASAGLAPAGGSGTTKYLRQDGSWQVPPDNNTTYANATTASNGLLPKLGGGTTNYLRADGSWAKPANDNTTYTNGTGLSLNGSTFSINQSASTVAYATKADVATKDGSSNTITSYYAPKQSPTFTGTPIAPDVASGDSSGKIANTKFVTEAINAAISGVTGLRYEIVTTLPTTGEPGVIYLKANGSTATQNIYDEYIWLGSSYEKIGTTAMDLSNYLNTVSETGTGNAYTSFTKNGNTLTLTKGATFLTSVPSQYATTATYTAANGISKSGTQFSNSGVRAIAESTVNGSINVNTNGSTANVAVHGLGAMAYKASVSKSDVGLGNVANLNQSKAITTITRSGLTFTATAIDGSTFSFTQKDDNTTYGVATTAANGLLPKLGGGTTNYLRADGSWAKPNDTTYAVATTAANGLLPKLGGGTTNFLRADGSWAKPTGTTYANMTSASAGLAPAGGSGTTKYLRQDGSWQVPPDNNTTYGNVSTTAAGLAPKVTSTSAFLKGDGTWATPTNTTYAAKSGGGLTLNSGSFSINTSASTVAYSDRARLSTNATSAAWADSSYYARELTADSDIDCGEVI